VTIKALAGGQGVNDHIMSVGAPQQQTKISIQGTSIRLAPTPEAKLQSEMQEVVN